MRLLRDWPYVRHTSHSSKKSLKVTATRVPERGVACVARHPHEPKTHLVGDESAESAQPEIIAVRPLEHVLRGVKRAKSKGRRLRVRSKGNLLQAREAPTSLKGEVPGGIEGRRLKSGLAANPFDVASENMLQLVSSRWAIGAP